MFLYVLSSRTYKHNHGREERLRITDSTPDNRPTSCTTSAPWLPGRRRCRFKVSRDQVANSKGATSRAESVHVDRIEGCIPPTSQVSARWRSTASPSARCFLPLLRCRAVCQPGVFRHGLSELRPHPSFCRVCYLLEAVECRMEAVDVAGST